MNSREYYISKIDKIAKESFNAEQKEIAKKIINAADEKDLDAVWGLVSQRVKIGFTFDQAPEVNHQAVAVIKENEKLYIPAAEPEIAIEHKLIIGENYDALKNLLVTYTDTQGKGLIDVIYIDPPYNTEKTKEDGNDYKEEVEAKKFIYRDKFTRDGWLNMMNERLKLARRLLSDKGVIFISIDDTMQAYLKVLCDEIFGEDNFITSIAWQGNDTVKNDAKYFSRNHEFILCYAKNKDNLIIGGLKRTDEHNKVYKNYDNDPKGVYLLTPLNAKSGSEKNQFEYKFQNGVKYIPPKGTFHRFSIETLKQLEKDGQIYFGKKGSVPQKKTYLSEVSEFVKLTTFWSYEFAGSTRQSNAELASIISKGVFDNPKPTKLVKIIINATTNTNSIVLDFFGGSGTTGQAVMELNAEDNGTRKFILVTNNENDIATKITRERLYRVINGKGRKGESIDWKYNDEKKSLKNNSVRVFEIHTESLTIADVEKAEKIKEAARKDFVKLNENYKTKDDLDIYTQLASLNPYKKGK